MHSHHSSFTFWKPCGLPLFSIFHSSLSCSLESFITIPCIYQSFSAAVGDLMRCRGLWHQGGTECVFTCCLAQLREMCEGVWRQSGHVCDLKRLNGDGSTPLPSHPHSPYPDKGKPLTGSDGAKLVRIALPAPLSSPPCRSSLFSLRLFLCHSASVFGGGLHKSRTASPSGRHRILIEKEIRNENSHSFSGLCSVKARKCTRGKKTKCGVDERNRSCS